MAASKKPTGKTPSKKAGSPGVFDIARPGSGSWAPSSTSRPVIIKHQLMPDPMVNDEPRADLPVMPLKPAKKVVITPIHESLEPVDNDEETIKVTVKPAAAEEPTEAITVSEASAAEPVAEPEPSAVPEPAKPAKEPAPEPKPAFSPGTTIADVAPEPDTTAIPADSQARQAETEVARARAAKLQKMIDEEEYFLPIETVEERRSRKVIIIGLILIVVLALAWYNVALDANLLPNTYNLPHTHLFSIKS